MRTIIAGTRTYKRINDVVSHVYYAVDECGWKPSVVLCGMARGPDLAGKAWAEVEGIPVEEYPANWAKFGRGAGLIRNTEMALKADALIAMWDGVSKGTGHMIDQARANNLKIHVYWFNP